MGFASEEYVICSGEVWIERVYDKKEVEEAETYAVVECGDGGIEKGRGQVGWVREV
jgi:hypothetical protein